MPRVLTPLPFDQRNEKDFEEMTERIKHALDIIRKKKTIRATVKELAGLAAPCSPKTLYLRSWPIIELKKIKEDRRINKGSVPKVIKGQRGNIETEYNHEILLIKQVQNYQDQNGALFDQVQDLKAQVSMLENAVKVITEEKAEAEEENRKLKNDRRKFTSKQNTNSNVVNMNMLKSNDGVEGQ
jgi:hypothetical protein